MAIRPPRKLPPPLRLLFFGSVPAVLIGVGTVGYRYLEGWSWFYSFYVAVITLTSIGHGETTYLSTAGHLFTMALALGGIFTVAVAATELLSTIITGELRDFLGKWRMRKRIEALQQHVIVCGYGHVGQHVCTDLLAAGAPVVVIDRVEATLAVAGEAGAHPVLGDASADATLTLAGIGRARALIAVAGADADNVLITMTARLLLSRPADRLAGGRRVHREQAGPRGRQPDRLAPRAGRRAHGSGGAAPSRARLHRGRGLEGGTPTCRWKSNSSFRAVRSTADRRDQRPSFALGLILVAIKRPDGHLAFNPDDDAPVAAGDTLITLGSREQLGRADALALTR